MNPFSMRQSSDIWESHQQTKIAFTQKLRAYYILGMLVTIQIRIYFFRLFEIGRFYLKGYNAL